MPMVPNKLKGKFLSFAMMLLLGLVYSVLSHAHPLAPALLEITEERGGTSQVLWKTPLPKIANNELTPQFPATCHPIGKTETKQVGTAYVQQWRIACDGPWVGSSVGALGFSSGQPNVIVRIALTDGLVYQRILNQTSPSFTIPERTATSEIFKNYFRLGIQHILTGWDHLLFVLGLVLLVRGPRQLLWTVTAFTVGHSLTLSAAALGWVHVPSAPVEAAIAFSILLLAVELLRKQDGNGTFFHRYPWSLAFGFGLLHGLGFAGALAEIGFPVGEIPMALFSFNVGIESGQLLFIGGILALHSISRLFPLPSLMRKMEVPAYCIGSFAAFWFFERLFRLWI